MPSPGGIFVCRESGTEMRIIHSKESLPFPKVTVSFSIFLSWSSERLVNLQMKRWFYKAITNFNKLREYSFHLIVKIFFFFLMKETSRNASVKIRYQTYILSSSTLQEFFVSSRSCSQCLIDSCSRAISKLWSLRTYWKFNKMAFNCHQMIHDSVWFTKHSCITH